MKRFILLLIFLSVIITSLLAFFPAKIAWDYVAPHAPKEIKLFNINGSVWSGYALTATIAGEPVERLSWTWQPSAIFEGQLQYDISYRWQRDLSSARIGTDGEKFHIRDANVQFPARLLHGLQRELRVFKPSGTVHARINEAQFNQDYFPQYIDGQVNWSDASVIAIQKVKLGRISAKIFTDDGQITAVIKDKGSPLALDFSCKIDQNRTYKIKGKLSVRDDKQAMLRMLSKMSLRHKNGVMELNLSGRL